MPKTITDIIPPSRRRLMNETGRMGTPQDMGEGAPPPLSPPPSFEDSEHPPVVGKKFPYGYALATFFVVIASVLLLFAFGGAKVEVTPVMKKVNVDSSFSATPSTGDLPYEVITAEVIGEKEIDAEGEETVDLPAQGQITIYNAQAKVQELIKNTRFETPDGKIFRIRDSLSVPGGSDAKPGAITATVYADAGGSSYNIGPSTFTLPGLQGSSAFDLVYAKSEQAMSGGFSGTRPSVPTETRLGEYESMREKLESDLRKKIYESVSDTHVLIEGALSITLTPEPDADAASDKVKLVQKATANAFIFKKEALAKAIAYATLGVYTGQPITLRGSDTLTFSFEEGVAPTPGSDSLRFVLKGETELLWLVDTNEIAAAIAGKTRDASKTILAGFSELEGARIILKPFWQNVMPEDPAKIKVEVKEPLTAK